MVTLDIYLGNPEAFELRNIGIQGLEAYGDYLLDGDPAKVGAVLDVNANMIGRGIVANMNAVPDSDPEWQEKRRAIIDDPLSCAQYVCGQLVAHWARVGLNQVNLSVLAEHDQLQSAIPNMYVIDSKVAPKEATNAMGKLAFLSFMSYLLAAE